MKTKCGPVVQYELVYRLFPQTIHTLKDDGFYHEDGKQRGCLVLSESMGQIMYHRPEEVMQFKCDARRLAGI